MLKNMCLPTNGGLCTGGGGNDCYDCSQIVTNNFFSYPTLDFWRVNQTGCTIPNASWTRGSWIYFPSCHATNVKWSIIISNFGSSDAYIVPQLRINGIETDLVTYHQSGSGSISTGIVTYDNSGLGYDNCDGIGSRVYGNAGDVNSAVMYIFKYEVWGDTAGPMGYII